MPEEQEYKELLQQPNPSVEIKKYLDRIKKEQGPINEYNKASVTEYELNIQRKNKVIGPNEGNILRVINKNDTTARASHYSNIVKSQNRKRLKTCINGMDKLNELCYL